MVSPSNKFTTSKSDFNIGVVPSRTRGTLTKKSSSSASLDKKLLLGKKYYLDIKSRAESNKLEHKFKSFGAEVQVFLTRDVHLVVSDHSGVVGNGLHSPAASISPVTIPSPAPEGKPSTPRSRASAMLDRVPLATSRRLVSALDLAQVWGVPILSVIEAHRWLARVKQRKTVREEPVKTYLKIESSLGINKPELLEFDKWPGLNLSGYLGQCPFRSPSPNSGTSRSHSKEDDDLRHDRTAAAGPVKKVLAVTNRQLAK